MNEADRLALARLSQKIDDLSEKLEPLTESEIDALRELAALTPALRDMSAAWKSAAWFGGAVKWIGGLASAVIVLWAVMQAAIGWNK